MISYKQLLDKRGILHYVVYPYISEISVCENIFELSDGTTYFMPLPSNHRSICVVVKRRLNYFTITDKENAKDTYARFISSGYLPVSNRPNKVLYINTRWGGYEIPLEQDVVKDLFSSNVTNFIKQACLLLPDEFYTKLYLHTPWSFI